MRFTISLAVLALLSAPAARAQEPGAMIPGAPAPEAIVDDIRYRIAPSDVLVIKYRYTPEYDYTVTVPPDGIIALPIVGEVKVTGLTVADAKDAIWQQASRRLRDPELTIELKEFQRPRFIIGGEVGAPGQFELRGRVTVLEAIAIAGGFKTSAKQSQVVLFRRYDDEHVFTRVLDAEELAKPSEQAEGLLLQPGDFLLVPRNNLSKIQSIMPIAGLGALFVTPFLVR